MSSTSLSMATPPSSSTSLYSNKLSSPPCFSFSLSSPKPKKLPVIPLKSQTPFSLSSFSLLNLSNSRPLLLFSAAASFEAFEPESEHNPSTELEEGEESEGADEYVSQEEEEDEEQKEEGVTTSSESGRLYVGNLPYSMSSAQLAEVFEEAGHVVNVEIVYDRVTDRSRGFAFVTMGSVEEAQEAIRMFDGSQVGGRTVKVNFPEVPRGGERELAGPRIRNSNRGFIDSPHKLYAGNLGWGLTSQGLRDAFADRAGVLSAKVVYDRDSGRSRGFGFVSFESAEAVESALNSMNGVEVEGRPLRLNMAAKRASSPSFEENVENNPDTSELLSSFSS